MKYELYQEVALAIDLPESSLRQGDVATIVERHESLSGEPGYTLEVFNAIGETLAVVAVSESAIESLSAGEVLAVRQLTATD
jgi:hypothetical protein